jgi:hypothetical protein
VPQEVPEQQERQEQEIGRGSLERGDHGNGAVVAPFFLNECVNGEKMKEQSELPGEIHEDVLLETDGYKWSRSPEEMAASLKKDEATALINFTPGIYDALWVFEQYTLLSRHGLLAHRTGCRFVWTDFGHAVVAELKKRK